MTKREREVFVWFAEKFLDAGMRLDRHWQESCYSGEFGEEYFSDQSFDEFLIKLAGWVNACKRKEFEEDLEGGD
jgi:hypothetical protein